MVKNSPRIALIYDRVNTAYGGAEKVLLALHHLFPDAPLFTSVYDPQTASWAKVFEIKSSWLQKIPGASQAHRWLVGFMPLAFESFNFDEYDIIISVTSAEAKGVLTKPHQLHICYLLTPTRYLYSHQEEYLKEGLGEFLQLLARPILSYLRWWDEAAAYRPDVIIPISKLVAERCAQYYHRSTHTVIYPPVALPTQSQTESSKDTAHQKDYFLVISRLVPYKRIDLVITACLRLQKKLLIVGDGPEKNRLQTLAQDSPLIQFMGVVPEKELILLKKGATAVVMPGIEDFGITALESVAQGIPVILHRKSGAAEILTDGKEAIMLDQLDQHSLELALRKVENTSFSKMQMRKKIQNYDTNKFYSTFQAIINQLWREFTAKGKYESA